MTLKGHFNAQRKRREDENNSSNNNMFKDRRNVLYIKKKNDLTFSITEEKEKL